LILILILILKKNYFWKKDFFDLEFEQLLFDLDFRTITFEKKKDFLIALITFFGIGF